MSRKYYYIAYRYYSQKVLLHNISILCPEIATYVENCYAIPARLIVTDGLEITSREGTTQ